MTTLARSQAMSLSDYILFLKRISTIVIGMPILWIGKNRDGLERQFQGIVIETIRSEGISCMLKIGNVIEGEQVCPMSNLYIVCLKRIPVIDDLVQAQYIRIPEYRGRVILS